MSKRETQMTRWYWNQVGGTLIEEFPAVVRGSNQGRRLLDGVIVLGEENRIANSSEVVLAGKDIIIVQSKNSRLGMCLMGRTLFSIELMRGFNPRTIKSIALCAKDDNVLRPLLERFPECTVVVCPREICRLTARPRRGLGRRNPEPGAIAD